MFETLNFIREEFMMRRASRFNEDKGRGGLTAVSLQICF